MFKSSNGFAWLNGLTQQLEKSPSTLQVGSWVWRNLKAPTKWCQDLNCRFSGFELTMMATNTASAPLHLTSAKTPFFHPYHLFPLLGKTREVFFGNPERMFQQSCSPYLLPSMQIRPNLLALFESQKQIRRFLPTSLWAVADNWEVAAHTFSGWYGKSREFKFSLQTGMSRTHFKKQLTQNIHDWIAQHLIFTLK